jgi:hypothetical protein
MTVLLLSAGHSYHLSDGSALQDHKPLLIARAGACSGDCPNRDAGVAQYVYADQPLSTSEDSLQAAVGGGGAWTLSGSDITLQKASGDDPDLPALTFTSNTRAANSIIPSTAAERQDISWIADLKQICGSGCALDPSVLASVPPANVVARLHLRSGNVFTYAVTRIGSNVTPAHFSRLDGSGAPAAYSQAVASWVGNQIEIAGSGIEIAESKFNGDPGRTMTLTPDSNNVIEIAVLNLPPFVPPASANNNAPQVGKHFEAYYDLMQTPPSQATRLVPVAGPLTGAQYPSVAWTDVHPQSDVYSDLLTRLRLDIGRSAYERILCPPGTM